LEYNRHALVWIVCGAIKKDNIQTCPAISLTEATTPHKYLWLLTEITEIQGDRLVILVPNSDDLLSCLLLFSFIRKINLHLFSNKSIYVVSQINNQFSLSNILMQDSHGIWNIGSHQAIDGGNNSWAAAAHGLVVL
jgi:hypothetical protein